MTHVAKCQARSPLAVRFESLACLFRLMSISFSYPDEELAGDLTSMDYLNACQARIADANIVEALSPGEIAGFIRAAQLPAPKRASDLKREMTRLFYVPNCPIPLEGSHWIQMNERDEKSRRMGERGAVGHIYRSLGLKNRPEATAPFDHLVSELDFMSYVTFAASRAWDAGDTDNAREWRLLGEDFARHHLYSFALGVASRTKRLSRNACLHVTASVLCATITSLLSHDTWTQSGNRIEFKHGSQQTSE